MRGFQDGAERARHGVGQAPRDRRQAEPREELVQKVPEDHGLALTDEVALAGDGRTGLEPVGRKQVRVSRVLDVRDVHLVPAVADDDDLAGACALHDARNQVVVAGAPDEVRPERRGQEVAAVRGDDGALGHGLRRRVARAVVLRIGQRLVGVFQVAPGEDDAGRARVHEPLNAARAAGVDDVARADDVRAVEGLPRTPEERQRRHVEHAVDADAGAVDGVPVLDIGLDHLGASRFQLRIAVARHRPDGIAARDELFHDVAAEEAATAGDEGLHRGRESSTRSKTGQNAASGRALDRALRPHRRRRRDVTIWNSGHFGSGAAGIARAILPRLAVNRSQEESQ
ncbi:MAG: hypothetical protein HYU41_16760 [Candidatus Rokubacteria bacterium]|nr:hypothetical protein [Candidatus Rokubacteria bacterium]